MRITHVVAVLLMTIATTIRAQAPQRPAHHARPPGRRCEVTAPHRLPSRSASPDRSLDSMRSSRPTQNLYISACDAVYRIRLKVAGVIPGPDGGKMTSGTPK